MKIKKYFIGALIGIVNGFFASGGGIIAVLALENLLKLDPKKSHATAIAIILPLAVAGITVYMKGGFLDAGLTLKASIGGAIGAVIGAKLLSKLPKKYIRGGFGVVMIISAVRMFFR